MDIISEPGKDSKTRGFAKGVHRAPKEMEGRWYGHEHSSQPYTRSSHETRRGHCEVIRRGHFDKSNRRKGEALEGGNAGLRPREIDGKHLSTVILYRRDLAADRKLRKP